MKKMAAVFSTSVLLTVFIVGCTLTNKNSTALPSEAASSSVNIANSKNSSISSEPVYIWQDDIIQSQETADFVLLSDITDKFSLSSGDTFKDFLVKFVQYDFYSEDYYLNQKGNMYSAKSVFVPTGKVTLTGTLSYGADSDSLSYLFQPDENSRNILPILAELFSSNGSENRTPENFKFRTYFTDETLNYFKNTKDETAKFFLAMPNHFDSYMESNAGDIEIESIDFIECTITVEQYSTSIASESCYTQSIDIQSITLGAFYSTDS